MLSVFNGHYISRLLVVMIFILGSEPCGNLKYNKQSCGYTTLIVT